MRTFGLQPMLGSSRQLERFIRRGIVIFMGISWSTVIKTKSYAFSGGQTKNICKYVLSGSSSFYWA